MMNLGELELLFHVRHRGLALQAGEGARDELRVNRVRADHLATDAEQAADLCRGELTNPVEGGREGGRAVNRCGEGRGGKEVARSLTCV